MKIQEWCQPHWDALRAAVEARGLGGLVSRGGEAAAAQMADELTLGTVGDREGFDPLLRSWSMISGQALEMGAGLAECPLCYVETHHNTCTQPDCLKPTPDDWIAGCVDGVRAYAQEIGLVP